MTIKLINFLCASILAAQAFVFFAFLHHKKEKTHLQAFLIFWGVVWISAFIDYLLDFMNKSRTF
ncbi:hypothetical protein CCP4SC76_6040002 [Gammaproteobacteria bacterium]